MNKQRFTLIHLIIVFLFGIVVMYIGLNLKITSLRKEIEKQNELIDELKNNINTMAEDNSENNTRIEELLKEYKNDIETSIDNLYYELNPSAEQTKIKLEDY